VPPVGVVPALDETEYRVACLDLRSETPPVKQLTLKSREEKHEGPEQKFI